MKADPIRCFRVTGKRTRGQLRTAIFRIHTVGVLDLSRTANQRDFSRPEGAKRPPGIVSITKAQYIGSMFDTLHKAFNYPSILQRTIHYYSAAIPITRWLDCARL